ncbi:DMT family transporter [Pseudomonas sp. KNUC1026]|uniref:DMT family transporter n=1 Tax=Pseudomonas sp. KNUC1026 TaxID=2893890 RepID=UPI001F315240|nr:DMT family transporter [Pseudomonas sp. KNUC1026]UFH50844.1 DMT family transporter [Pseudomonas sp. KNUC1026]
MALDTSRPATSVTAARQGRLLVLTALAMLAFAGNSVLCRLALKATELDPLSFTAIRLISGAAMLWLLLRLRAPGARLGGGWAGGLALFVYALCFSLAYVQVETGAGALVLFGAVQLTMLLYGLARGERLSLGSGAGLLLAVVGLLALLLPGANAPPLPACALMAAAGIAWGVYSLLGKGARDPLVVTTGNFLRALPIGLLACLPRLAALRWDGQGALYAVLSGALASGLGYALWYSVLPRLPAVKAASVQLSVPVLAALAGVLFLGEALSLRLVLCAVAVLGGVGCVLVARR